MANLHSVLILGSDAVAAASPASAVQLVHACHRWGFSTVVPASWGDELLAGEVIRRCAARENRPAIQCSCPRVAERLGPNAAKLDDAIFWLATPPVSAAQYLRAHANGMDMHITYAGGCPGAADSCIDEQMSPTELLLAISSRGIDIGAQPTVFENIIPPDRRRHLSSASGIPDAQRLWEASAFRIAQPSDIDLSIGVAQLLLADERVLVDMSALVGCVCRTTVDTDPSASLRSGTPIVRDGVIDVSRSAPAIHSGPSATLASPPFVEIEEIPPSEPAAGVPPVKRNSPAKPVFRRSVAWRRQTPRPGVVVTRTSAVVVAVAEPKTFLARSGVRIAIATLVAVATFMIGLWFGRRNVPSSSALTGAAPIGQRAASPSSRSP